MERLRPQDILRQKDHRHFPVPDTDWTMYSEWRNVLMLHWKVDASAIRHLLPPALSLDTFEGGAWVTMCVASVENFRNKLLNIIKQGFKFNQVLMQTYVIHQGRPGLFIFNQELERSFTKNLYQKFFKLKQGETEFQIEHTNEVHKFFASNQYSGFKLGLHYNCGDAVEPSPLEIWLSDRFKYFCDKEGQLNESHVHHARWAFRDVNVEKFKTRFNYGGLHIEGEPDFIHFSPGIQKLFWPRSIIK